MVPLSMSTTGRKPGDRMFGRAGRLHSMIFGRVPHCGEIPWRTPHVYCCTHPSCLAANAPSTVLLLRATAFSPPEPSLKEGCVPIECRRNDTALGGRRTGTNSEGCVWRRGSDMIGRVYGPGPDGCLGLSWAWACLGGQHSSSWLTLGAGFWLIARAYVALPRRAEVLATLSPQRHRS